MSEKLPGWRGLPIGGVIDKAGSAENYETGSWRVNRPILDKNKCTSCLMCWMFCPDTSIIVKDGKVTGIDLAHCKGCGICARECPLKDKAITMQLESQCELA